MPRAKANLIGCSLEVVGAAGKAMVGQDDLAYKALSIGARKRILALLAREGPLSTDEIVTKTQMSKATVRHHMMILERARLVESSKESPSAVGRPSNLYVLTREWRDLGFPRRQFQLLAGELLETTIRSSRRRAVALMRSIGERMAKELLERQEKANFPVKTFDEFQAHILPVLDEMGMEPVIESKEKDAMVVATLNCIYYEVAKKYRDVVCEGHKAFFRKIGDAMNCNAERTTCIQDGANACRTRFARRRR